MSIKRSAVHTLALLAAVILGIVLLLGAIRTDTGLTQMAAVLAVLAIGLFALTLAASFTTKEQLFMAVIYILIACTFLNNAFSRFILDSLVCFFIGFCSSPPAASILWGYCGAEHILKGGTGCK